MAAVVDAEPCSDDVANRAADGEGEHEFFSRHVERARGEDEGAERHRRRKDRRKRNGEDCMALHPFADAFEDAGGDAFFEKRHAAALTDLIAEESAERGASGCEKNEEDDVLMPGGHEDDQNVGDAGHGQRDEGAIDDGDEEDAEDTEAGEIVQEGTAGAVRSSYGLGCGRYEVLRRVDSRREELHT